MMGSATRDPYWRLRLAIEAGAAGVDAAKIQNKCLRCHAAADQHPLRSGSKLMRVEDLTALGREGVTCTVCHRIAPWIRDADAPSHRIPTRHCQTHSRCALCGTCHTLLLTDATGRVTLPEQTTYLEWVASEYPESKTTCQTCHDPAVRTADGRPAFEYIAHRPPGGPFPPTRPRSPIGLHSWRQCADASIMASTVESPSFLDQAIATSRFLRSAVALHLTAQRTTGHRLIVRVTIRNLTGHKLPTGLPGAGCGYPTVFDRRNRVLLETGVWDHDTGELKRAQGSDRLLTQAVRYRKDNRLLPAGFNRMALPQDVAAEWIAPVGTGNDPDFTAGQDTVRYWIPVPKSSGPIRISVEVCFQSIRPASAVAIPGLHRGPEVIANAEIVAGGG